MTGAPTHQSPDEMTKIEDIATAASQLSAKELDRFRDWLEAIDAQRFDRKDRSAPGCLRRHGDRRLRGGRNRERRDAYTAAMTGR